MEANFQIEVCSKKNIDTIITGINDYNLNKVSASSDNWKPIEFTIKNEKGIAIGGILGGIGYWNGLEVKILWVDQSYRSQGLGSKLLAHAEAEARENGATISMLDTFDFQAPDFYLKNGYSIDGKIEDFPPGHTRIFLSKTLN